MTQRNEVNTGIVLGVLLAGLIAHPPLYAAPTPEQEVLRLSRKLKPISDSDWQTLAGARLSERYVVVKGDTLFDLSKRLFGDTKYWPKIWALNNAAIRNPHEIKPGDAVVFMPGTGTSLPGVTVNASGEPQGGLNPSANSTSASLADASANSTSATHSDATNPVAVSLEWKLLPATLGECGTQLPAS